MTVKRSWKVYGADGHRQRESFCPSHVFEVDDGDCTSIVEVENSDKTGTNDYSIVRITSCTSDHCEDNLWAQIWDGTFENSRVGDVVEIFD